MGFPDLFVGLPHPNWTPQGTVFSIDRHSAAPPSCDAVKRRSDEAGLSHLNVRPAAMCHPKNGTIFHFNHGEYENGY